ncbi:MAG: Poly(glycerol-phosphate) alpha-glucosyltransferase [candidate division WS2 bacterium]|uniref:Poly(Glycerol-phosphate) alpha-glucosyltransferase n=1 Tax=Psychracetigena formicireducens TaxID=2986056 RepID=A0A9E2BMR4_PSYF1|nr:Poly(glycerol-phosphate) alpha-glucosyltransferase [Candidatus Psychracetigena formicireducens]
MKGGAEKRVYEISKRLVVRGHEVHWFGLKWWDGKNDIGMDGVHLHGIGKWDNLYVNGRRSIREGLYFGIKTLTGLKGDFDVIDCQQFPYFSCFSAKVHSLLNKSKLVITWYEIWGDYWFEYLGKKGIFGWSVERMIAKIPHLAIPISEKIKEDLKSLGVSEEIMRVVPNGVDFYGLQGIKPSSERFDVIYVGRLISHKNVDILLKAISVVKKEISNVTCGIIGDGPEMNKLKVLSTELELNDNVKFFGFIENDEDVYARMKASKVFVLPSTREGFPNTIVEANSCGLPAIIVRHKNNAGVGVVKDGYNGFILNLSPEEIAKRIIICLLQDENTRDKLSRNALGFAKIHDWDVIVDKIERVYKDGVLQR